MNFLTPLKSHKKISFLIRKAINNKNVKLTANTYSTITNWEIFFNIPKINNMFVVNDTYDIQCEWLKYQEKKEKYCFTGGMNNRDWKIIIQLAKSFSNIKFVCVANKSDFQKEVNEVPDNMEVFFDISLDNYYELMKNSSLVLLPLKDQRVAGLINILKAVEYGVLCAVTKTDASSVYYPEGLQYLLVENGFNKWYEVCNKVFGFSNEKYDSEIEKERLFIINNYSPTKVFNALEKIIKDF